jgi:tetratricopeptide (TPR) repeat protein
MSAMRIGGLPRMLLLAGALLAGGGAAEARQGASLESVEAAMAAGRLTEARQLLERWNRENPVGGRASGADRARALLNAGRLSTDAAAAEEAYLGVVLAHPSTPAAPEALLRLGQALLAGGDAARATAYLERLAADYPTAQQRAPGLLWLGRAHGAAGRRDAACATFTRAVEAAADAETRGLAEADRAACTAAPAAAAPASPPPAAAPPAGAARGGAAPAPATAARFALQAGAFRERPGAESHAARLRQAGLQPRVVTVEGSALWRVRLGAFATSDEANREARALAARGFEVIVVSDARNERR